MIKRLLPVSVKLNLHRIKNFVKDVTKGYYFRYANQQKNRASIPVALQLTQKLSFNEAKIINLKLAIKIIETYIIKPHEIFSFWEIVGNPTVKKGFVESRSIVNGEIKGSVGGGLCQLSGLVYYASLYADLKIIERYNHSKDIYTDETRFTPLGSDATVAFGYKDLKIENNSNETIRFSFTITAEEITIHLHSKETIEKQKIDFKESNSKIDRKETTTFINNKPRYYSSYRT